jgi:endonuclease YncB( thermonuclease family)
MALFYVDSVIDGDTFTVNPGWVSGDKSGSTVRPTGYNTPEFGTPQYLIAKSKLASLILNKRVELGPAVNFDHGRIVCSVFLDGRNISEHFPEYQV